MKFAYTDKNNKSFIVDDIKELVIYTDNDQPIKIIKEEGEGIWSIQLGDSSFDECYEIVRKTCEKLQSEN